jgi:hypothetical protein
MSMAQTEVPAKFSSGVSAGNPPRFLGFSPSEAEEVIGQTANAFRVRLHRARKRFREVFSFD